MSKSFILPLPALALLGGLFGLILHHAMIHANRATTIAVTIALDPSRFAVDATITGIRLAMNLCWRSCGATGA